MAVVQRHIHILRRACRDGVEARFDLCLPPALKDQAALGSESALLDIVLMPPWIWKLFMQEPLDMWGRARRHNDMSAKRSFNKLLLTVIILVIIAAIVTSGTVIFHKCYPHGIRTAYLLAVTHALGAYADEHDGWFPDGGTSPLYSLGKLYPRYIPAECLSGLSGDRTKVKYVLEAGGSLTNTTSSWIYVPGFHINDNPRIAIIWEAKEGLLYNGRSMKGIRVAGFINGEVRIIPVRKWPDFEREQLTLRQDAKERHEELKISRPHE